MESKLFKIQIEKYAKDINSLQSKEKQEEIYDLFTNYNKLDSEEKFREVESKLHLACSDGDVELIKIYLSETIEDYSKDLVFKVDESKRTASLFKVNNTSIKQLIITRIVNHNSTDYLITSICGSCDSIKTLKFADDSAVKTIHRFAFPLFSKIEEIYLPKSLKELKKGWCTFTKKLNKIIVSQSNDHFIMKSGKFLFGKSDVKKDEFDSLVFACRDIKEICIPSNIKILSPHSLYYCANLQKIEIPTNSNLQKIGDYAFSYSMIKEFSIPFNVEIISSGAFAYCSKLTKIEIPPNSLLQKIESKTFSRLNIRSIFIAKNISEICELAFEYCENLNIIEIAEESKLESFPLSAFSWHRNLIIMMPSSLVKLTKINKSI